MRIQSRWDVIRLLMFNRDKLITYHGSPTCGYFHRVHNNPYLEQLRENSWFIMSDNNISSSLTDDNVHGGGYNDWRMFDNEQEAREYAGKLS